MEPLVARVVADRRRTQRGIRKRLSFVPSWLPRARASVRRWSARALEVHAGTYVEVLLIFGVEWRVARAALSHSSETGGAREPTDANRCDGSVGRTVPGISPGRLFPTAHGLCPHARRASSTLPVGHLLRKLTARTSLLRLSGRRRVLPRDRNRTVLGVVLGDLVDRVLIGGLHELVVWFLTVEPLQ